MLYKVGVYDFIHTEDLIQSDFIERTRECDSESRIKVRLNALREQSVILQDDRVLQLCGLVVMVIMHVLCTYTVLSEWLLTVFPRKTDRTSQQEHGNYEVMGW